MAKTLFGTAEVETEITDKEWKAKPKGGLTLWEMVDMLFQNPEKFSKISSYDKGKEFFMMQRTFAIKYPIQAAAFNSLKINPGAVIQYWCTNLSKLHNRTPGWIYQAFKEIKKHKTVEAKKLDVKDETIRKYCELNECSRRDVEDAYKAYGNDFIEELKEIEKNFG